MSFYFEKVISVCIPLCKPNGWYLECLAESLRKQSYAAFEVVISDDWDSQMDVDRLFFGLDVKYLKNTGRKGIFSNLNNSIKASTGEYIQIVCQDDVLEPSMLTEQLKVIQSSYDVGFVYTQNTQIDEKGIVLCKKESSGYGLIPKSKLVNFLFVWGCLPGNLSTVMIKRSVLNELALFDETLTYAADFHFWIRSSFRYSMAINYTPLLLLRSHPGQASKNLSAKLLLNDTNINVRLMYDAIDLKWYLKFVYANSYYGKDLLIRMLNEARSTKDFTSLIQIFKLKYPMNIFLSFFFLFLHLLRIPFRLNLGEYSVFPTPHIGDRS